MTSEGRPIIGGREGEKKAPGSLLTAMPGTCGELFQGVVDGVPCLVSCPVDRFAVLRVSSGRTALSIPPGMVKTKRALLRAGRVLPMSAGLSVERIEALPEGMGYASSTADILCALYGAAALSGASLEPDRATRIALSVEPTDSIAWPGLALLDHREGRIMEFLGPPPPMDVLVLHWGGTVDTVRFNVRDVAASLAALAPIYEEALALLREGVLRCSPEAVAEGASLSADACSGWADKPHLEECRALCLALGGIGVCVAHSGTLYGVLFPRGGLPGDDPAVERAMAGRLTPGWSAELRAVVPGGLRLPAGESEG